jgi:hypothetical protein
MRRPGPRLGSVAERAAAGLQRRLRVDTRALAAFRVGLGLLVLADLALRARDLRAFYTDAGVLPRSALVAHGDPLHWSLHAASGDPRVQALLFLVAAVLAVALTVGYRTTVATVGSWLLLVSLHNRMPEVLNGGDVLLRLLLFWGMFLPLGARWAVDSAHAARDTRESVTGVAAAALLLQVVAMYATNAAFKLGGDLWLRGVGLEYVFSLGQFTVLLGDHLAAYPGLLRVLDYVWLAAITASVLLVLLTGLSRAAFAGLLMTMHLGMLVTMRIHLFPLISVVALVPFLPAAVWDRLPARMAAGRPAALARRWGGRLAGALPVVTVSGVAPWLERWRRGVVTAVPLVFLVLVVLWNLQVLGVEKATGREVLPEAAEPALEITRTDQYWNMFAPDPLATDGWLVAPGRLENGSEVDAFHGGAVEWDRPPDVSSTYPTARWRKYAVGLWRADTADRERFAAYLCRRWNDRHDTDLERVAVYYVEQPTRIDAEREPTERVRLESHSC